MNSEDPDQPTTTAHRHTTDLISRETQQKSCSLDHVQQVLTKHPLSVFHWKTSAHTHFNLTDLEKSKYRHAVTPAL